MSWRTVVISSRCKLDLKMGYMVVRGEKIQRVFLDEIAILLIENPAVSMTGCLLSALVERKIKVIFCDNKHNPQAELVPFYGSHDTSKKIRQQTLWPEDIVGMVWTVIVTEKIRNQRNLLRDNGKIVESIILGGYIEQVEFQDSTNREGHAAKVYFNALFGKEFTRSRDIAINAALDYGYAILLSAFNREVCSNGYLTQIGLHHENVFNQFNLSCDLMEPFRPIIDKAVLEMMPAEMTTEIKRTLYNTLNQPIFINGQAQTTLNAISIYTKSVFDALNTENVGCIKFWSYEL